MRRIDRYLAGEFLRGMLPVLLLLGGLLGFLALAEELEDVGKGQFTTVTAIRVMLLTLPRILIDILPIIALLAALIGLGRMANHREIVALRAAGLSSWRIAAPLLLIALALVVAVFAARTWVIPDWERSALQLRATVLAETRIEGESTDYWTRSGERILRVGDVRYGRIPIDLEIYTLGPDRRVRSVIRAARADVIDDRRWLLHDVSLRELDRVLSAPIRHDRLELANPLDSERLASLIQPAESLAPRELIGYIASLEANGLNSHRYRFLLWQALSLPVALLAMTLLAVPFVLGSPRTVPVAQRVALGGGIGLLFYLLEQVIGHLAVLYRLDPLLLAMTPDATILLIALWAIGRRSR
ncbi:MAG TPA: LPS export ABC transporter permease LptG [Xanthomonadales bacterium]|nr:LPS export ABC transporter permease LptG [Xanthomonadales bacterium]